jgi:hypothetical protein
MIDDLRIIDNIDVLLEYKVVLYGAGYQGVKTLRRLKEAGLPAAYLCDSDPRKWGTNIEGTCVLSPNELKRISKTGDLAIIITTDRVCFIDQIIGDIEWLEINNNVFTMFALNIALDRNNKTNEINNGLYNPVLDMRRDIFCLAAGAYRLSESVKWAENESVVLVYSSPKAGTVTVTNSLNEFGISADHLHELAALTIFPDPINEGLVAKYKDDFKKILEKCKSIKVLTMIREPVIKNFSLIFHLLGHFEFKLNDVPVNMPFTDSLIERMHSYMGAPMDSLNWFDYELKAVFGIDVYAHPFNKDEGYSIIKQGNVEVLVMKLEKLSALEQTIARFVGIPRFKLVNDNESVSKLYKYLYQQVRKTVKLPRKMFDYYYNDTRMKHFYSEEEIAGFRKKWEKNIADKKLEQNDRGIKSY